MRTERSQNGRIRAAGFTLIEMLLVLVIIGLIGGLVVTNLVGRAEGAKISAAKAQVQRLGGEVENYYLDTGRFPDDLRDLVSDPGIAGWSGPYTKESNLKDPWGEEFRFEYPGQHSAFDLYSYGPDRQQGGSEDGEDITNWK